MEMVQGRLFGDCSMKVKPMKNIGLLVIAAACMVATSVDAAPKRKS
jgi:hypothetical protein